MAEKLSSLSSMLARCIPDYPFSILQLNGSRDLQFPYPNPKRRLADARDPDQLRPYVETSLITGAQ